MVRAVRVSAWLNGEHPKLLQVGGGRHRVRRTGWINGDLIAGEIYLNAKRRLPFPAMSLDAIFTEQFYEHLPQASGVEFLKECYRVLRPGGVIRQSTPDLGKLVALYEDRNDCVDRATAISRHMRNHRSRTSVARMTACQFVNDVFRLWGHQFIYDRTTLEGLMKDVGFKDFRWVLFGESEIDLLQGLERHFDDEWMKDGYVMIYEARK
jgi:predicted SAM-dependent methyltransferase